jgi:hypothetical protein
MVRRRVDPRVPRRSTTLRSAMSIPISKGGRLFGIVAGLGGAAMSGYASLSWAYASRGYPSYVIELRNADRRAMLVPGSW